MTETGSEKSVTDCSPLVEAGSEDGAYYECNPVTMVKAPEWSIVYPSAVPAPLPVNLASMMPASEM